MVAYGEVMDNRGIVHPRPPAYLLTWTCYGTWLHGDHRGSVDDEHNIFGTPFLSTDANRRDRDRGRLAGDPVRLTGRARRIVADTVTAHCDIRRWDLQAFNALSNHVHVVVDCGDDSPESALGQFKAWTTRRLRESGLFRPPQRIWTHHGSTRYLWNERSVVAAIAYVAEGQ